MKTTECWPSNFNGWAFHVRNCNIYIEILGLPRHGIDKTNVLFKASEESIL